MAFRKITYLIPACDECGLAWSFGDPACIDGIPPHFTCMTAALSQLPADYGWRVLPRRLGRPLMFCRRCAAAGVLSAAFERRRLLAVAGWVRRFVPCGPVGRATPANPPSGHPESVTTLLPPDQEDLLAAIDDELSRDL